uniref:Uncharacterized protein n=1 Tax=viral metagenome TaxID=1070528 RepID=A0A6C0D9Z0_9ZZZZ
MGIILKMKDEQIEIKCSYDYWLKFKIDIIKATVKYIEELLILKKTIFNDDLNYIINLYYIQAGNGEPMFSINKFINNMRLEHVDTLIYFGLGGVYSLLNKTDCDGYYSVGNSLDILHTLKKIRYDFPNNDYIPFLDQLISFFNISYEKQKMVNIY